MTVLQAPVRHRFEKMTDEPQRSVSRELQEYAQRLTTSHLMSGGTEWLMANMVGGTITGSIGGVQSGVIYFGTEHSLFSVGSSVLYKETIGDIRGHFI